MHTAEQDVTAAVNAPTDTLLGRPLIGNGANGYTNARGIGTSGHAGGLLFGSGGSGGISTAAGAAGVPGAAGITGGAGASGSSPAGPTGGTGGTGGTPGSGAPHRSDG